MVQGMMKSAPKQKITLLDLGKREPRFPKTAADYVDALLSIQRQCFEKEAQAAAQIASVRTESPAHPLDLPKSAHILAKSATFIGSGWSDIGVRKDGTAFRWMGRVGTQLLGLDLSEGAPILIKGCGFSRRRFLKDLTIWVDDQEIPGTLSRIGFNRWQFEGDIPSLARRHYHILRLQSPGVARLAVGVDVFVSLALSEIKVGNAADKQA